MSLIIPANSAAGGGFNIDNSCRFNSGDDCKISRTSPNSSPTNIDKFTLSCWVKRSTLGTDSQIFDTYNGSSGGQFQMYFKSDDTLRVQVWNSSNKAEFIPNRKFRDVSAWMNIIFVYDSTPSTPSSSSIKLFINGIQETSFATETYPSQNTDGEFAIQNHIQMIGTNAGNSTDFGGYMAEVIGVDGQALAHTQFGEFDEDSPTIWKPIDVSSINVGTLGFYLDFEDSSALGNDVSGVGDFTVTNLAATDQSTDTCTNNFITMNPLDNFFPDFTFSDGNLTITSGGNYSFPQATIHVAKGKWYWEVKPVSKASGGNEYMVGIQGRSSTAINQAPQQGGNTGIAYYGVDGDSYGFGGGATDYGDAYAADDIIGVALDIDNLKIYFSKNGTFQNSGDPTSGSTGTGALSITAISSVPQGGYSPVAGFYDSPEAVLSFNFGSPPYAVSSGNADGNGFGNFEYAPPSGYFALCTKNLAEFG